MKRLIIFVATIFMFQISFGQRKCGNIYNQAYLNSLSKQDKDKLNKFNNLVQKESINGTNGTPQTNSLTNAEDIILIPVVVHIVYNSSLQNISNDQICSQILVLNEDFSRQNSDVSNTPNVFASLCFDTKIRFYLATVDPNGNPTTGITRTNTSVTSFTLDDKIKHYSTGGCDAWPSNKYLNIWVGNLSNGLLGYAQFPELLSSDPTNDGVVINYKDFGKGAYYNLDNHFNPNYAIES